MFIDSFCFAYVGPGPGLTMIGVLIGFIVTLFAAFSAVALWPLRAMLRRLRENRDHANSGESHG